MQSTRRRSTLRTITILLGGVLLGLLVQSVAASGAFAASVSGVSIVPDSYLSDNPTASWDIGFTTSATGSLITGNTVDVKFPAGFDVSGATATFGTGFTGCTTPTTVISGQVIVIPLTGAGCSLALSTAGSVTITGIRSIVNQYARLGFSVTTYGDTTFTAPIDGAGASPPAPIDMLASVTYSTQASDGSPTTSGTGPVDPGSPYSINSPIVTVLGNSGALALAGHAFAGWCTTNVAPDPTQCTGTHYAPSDNFSITSNVTLYSQWSVAYAADGSGTNVVSPIQVLTSSSGATLTFTYTVAAGGMNDGELDILVPTGWSAPTSAASAGCTTTSAGTLAFASRSIQVSALTLAAGSPVTVVYGATSGGACTTSTGGVTPSAAGVSTFTTTQKSTAGGTLTTIATAPSVVVVDPVPTCSPGSFRVALVCVAAQPGSFVSASGATSQTPCAPGTFSAVEAATSCDMAPAGTFVSGAGSTSASSCAVDTFSSGAGAVSCLACPANTSTRGVKGQASCTKVAPADFAPCPTGKIKVGASCIIEPRLGFTGGSSNDHITGSAAGDKLSGGGGSDTVVGGRGNDQLKGDRGNDTLNGGSGNDSLRGGSGSDTEYGGPGRDRIAGDSGGDRQFGGGGGDTLSGGSGRDRQSGGGGHDVVSGGTGRDVQTGGAGDDRVAGASGNDAQAGGAGDDRLSGGSGNDFQSGNGGRDVIQSGSGADTVITQGNDTVRTGPGSDTITFQPGSDGTGDAGQHEAIDTGAAPDTIRIVPGEAGGGSGGSGTTSTSTVNSGSGADDLGWPQPVIADGDSMDIAISTGSGDDSGFFTPEVETSTPDTTPTTSCAATTSSVSVDTGPGDDTFAFHYPRTRNGVAIDAKATGDTCPTWVPVTTTLGTGNDTVEISIDDTQPFRELVTSLEAVRCGRGDDTVIINQAWALTRVSWSMDCEHITKRKSSIDWR
jgi:Ca2+-binding RTX toxin-like protein